MKKFLFLIFITLSLFAQEKNYQGKGYIDMHGGKSDTISGKGGFSSNMNLTDNPFAKKADDKHIPIQKIGNLEDETKMKQQKDNK